VAFYAPLKAPDHPTPSGDREIGRRVIAALGEAGFAVELACRFRSFDRDGDAARQARLADLGGRLADALIRRCHDRPPQLWLTYHLYHKAPDWLGPRVSRALGIPYVLVEASVTPRQAAGPWRDGHAATLETLGAADLVLALNPVDRAAVLPHLRPGVAIEPLLPFLETAPFRAAAEQRAARREGFASAYGLPTDVPWLLAVGMMRPGAKAWSYALLGESLLRCRDLDWRLVVIGDGPAEPEVAAALAPLRDRVVRIGALPPVAVTPWYATADFLVWPAIDEAIGMALLEAQAAGLPVVAGDNGAIPTIVRDGITGLTPPVGDVEAFAKAVRTLLEDPARRQKMGAAAGTLTAAEHDLSVAARRLKILLSGLMAS
jgi:glycosyltransferase involved in cell wall biosynthesis